MTDVILCPVILQATSLFEQVYSLTVSDYGFGQPIFPVQSIGNDLEEQSCYVGKGQITKRRGRGWSLSLDQKVS